MLLSIAYRNLWRNPLRTWILVCSIAVGMFAGIFALAFETGMLKQKTDDAIFDELSHLQIHKDKFKNMDNLNLFFDNAYEKCIEISSLKDVKSTTYRIIVNSIISTNKATTAVKISGIVPEIEKTTTNIHKKLIKGKYLTCKDKNSILISKDIAEKLHLKIKSAVSLQFQNIEGNIIKSSFIVCGIYRTGNLAFDYSNVFVEYDDLRRISGLPNNHAHEIAVLLDSEEKMNVVGKKMKQLFPYLITENWKELDPILLLMNKRSFGSTYLLIILILIALSFGITNSMCMVILDRIKELGMLMAVGMNKARIFSMLMLETIKITLLGGLVGVFLGMVAIEITGKTGLSILSFDEEIRQLGYDSEIHPYISTDQLLWIILLILVTAFFSSIYPALKALRYKPTDSIKSE